MTGLSASVPLGASLRQRLVSSGYTVQAEVAGGGAKRGVVAWGSSDKESDGNVISPTAAHSPKEAAATPSSGSRPGANGNSDLKPTPGLSTSSSLAAAAPSAKERRASSTYTPQAELAASSPKRGAAAWGLSEEAAAPPSSRSRPSENGKNDPKPTPSTSPSLAAAAPSAKERRASSLYGPQAELAAGSSKRGAAAWDSPVEAAAPPSSRSRPSENGKGCLKPTLYTSSSLAAAAPSAKERRASSTYTPQAELAAGSPKRGAAAWGSPEEAAAPPPSSSRLSENGKIGLKPTLCTSSSLAAAAPSAKERSASSLYGPQPELAAGSPKRGAAAWDSPEEAAAPPSSRPRPSENGKNDLKPTPGLSTSSSLAAAAPSAKERRASMTYAPQAELAAGSPRRGAAAWSLSEEAAASPPSRPRPSENGKNDLKPTPGLSTSSSLAAAAPSAKERRASMTYAPQAELAVGSPRRGAAAWGLSEEAASPPPSRSRPSENGKMDPKPTLSTSSSLAAAAPSPKEQIAKVRRTSSLYAPQAELAASSTKRGADAWGENGTIDLKPTPEVSTSPSLAAAAPSFTERSPKLGNSDLKPTPGLSTSPSLAAAAPSPKERSAKLRRASNTYTPEAELAAGSAKQVAAQSHL
eukprot:gene14291-20268_t